MLTADDYKQLRVLASDDVPEAIDPPQPSLDDIRLQLDHAVIKYANDYWRLESDLRFLRFAFGFDSHQEVLRYAEEAFKYQEQFAKKRKENESTEPTNSDGD